MLAAGRAPDDGRGSRLRAVIQANKSSSARFCLAVRMHDRGGSPSNTAPSACASAGPGMAGARSAHNTGSSAVSSAGVGHRRHRRPRLQYAPRPPSGWPVSRCRRSTPVAERHHHSRSPRGSERVQSSSSGGRATMRRRSPARDPGRSGSRARGAPQTAPSATATLRRAIPRPGRRGVAEHPHGSRGRIT